MFKEEWNEVLRRFSRKVACRDVEDCLRAGKTFLVHADNCARYSGQNRGGEFRIGIQSE